MNGRIYDPTLGRFLQADPYIQAPSNSQSYNRYAYVINNPLSYTDPSGYNFFKNFVKLDGFAAGVMSGAGTIGGIIQSSINHNLHKWVANSRGLTTAAGTVIGAFTSWWCGACGIGFSALFTSNMAAYSGASSSEAFHAGGRTAVTASVFYGIGQAFNNSSAFWTQNSVQHIAAHAIAGGIIADLQGGNFGHGFFAAGITKGFQASGKMSNDFTLGLIQSAVVGGTASKISGGKFANGAMTAAFQYLFNQCLSSSKCSYSKIWKDMKRTMSDYWGSSNKELDLISVAAVNTVTIAKNEPLKTAAAGGSIVSGLVLCTSGVGCAAGALGVTLGVDQMHALVNGHQTTILQQKMVDIMVNHQTIEFSNPHAKAAAIYNGVSLGSGGFISSFKVYNGSGNMLDVIEAVNTADTLSN